MFNGFFVPNKEQTDNTNGNVTVILTAWKRHHLEEQIKAILNQTIRPYQIWIYQCGDFVKIDKLRNKFSDIQCIKSSVNLKYFGRFSLAVYVKSKYVWILDDDVIPSRNWLEEGERMCNDMNAIIASAGRIISYNSGIGETSITDLRRFLVGDGCDEMPCNFNEHNKVVDFGCNSWLFKTDWITSFWKIRPYTLENAEDIHLSATCKMLNNVSTVVPAQSENELCGNLRKWYGHDDVASWKKLTFQKERIGVINYLVNEHGWETLQKK